MDGVFVDFLQTYLDLGLKINHPVKPPYTDNSRNPDLFRVAVLEHDIFANLPLMPSALALKQHVEDLEVAYEIKVEMLTSVNSFEPDVMDAARSQKQQWLDRHGFGWDMKCVSSNGEKANYATPNSILIDDNPECTIPFFEGGGQVILFKEFDHVFKSELRACIKNVLIKHHDNAF